VSAPISERASTSHHDPAIRTPNASHPNPHDHERQEEVGSTHRGREHPLDELLRAHLDDEVPDPPHAALHQVEADEPGDQEVDVASTRLGHTLVGHGQRISASRGALQDVVDGRAREPRLGTRLVESIGDGIAGHHDERHLSGAQLARRLVRRSDGRLHARRSQRCQGILRPWPVLDVDHDGLRGPVAKGDPERHREDHREAECPEQSARLAEEEPEARERELDQGRTRLRRFSHAGLVR
jgi:hypothetical protein